jgi:hypothetical protein
LNALGEQARQFAGGVSVKLCRHSAEDAALAGFRKPIQPRLSQDKDACI